MSSATSFLLRRCRLVLSAVCVITLGLPLTKMHAAAGPIPDGQYDCHKISGDHLIDLGTIEIKGSTYRVGDDRAFAPFAIDANGNITWSKGINFMPPGWKVLYSKYEGIRKEGPLFTIHYRSASGTEDTIDCSKNK